MRKYVDIEVINDDPSGCGGLKIYETRPGHEQSIPVARGADDGDVAEILTERQQEAYERGEWRFKVRADALLDKFQYLAR